MKDTTAAAAAPIDDRDRARADFGIEVALVRWPDQADLRAQLSAERVPRLLLVSAGAPAPDAWEDLEDWARLPLDPAEMSTRIEALRRRALRRTPVVLDGDGLLRRGRLWTAVPAGELAVLRPLLDAEGQLVSRSALLQAVRPTQEVDEARTLDTLVQRARRRVRSLGVTIHTIRGCGFLLEVGEPT